MSTSPDLSVILVTDTFPTIAPVLECYGADVDRSRLEIVVAATAPQGMADRITGVGFPHVRVVDAGDGTISTAELKALQAARAPFVVFGQHHAFPRSGFVPTILGTCLSGTWTVIGAKVVNANPATIWSRVALWINYGRWTAPLRGVMSDVPGHTSAYRRDALVALGAELEELFEAGWPLQLALAARGGRCFLEADATFAMTNPDRASTFFGAQFRAGRSTAFRRSRRWSFAHRLAYVFGAPLVWLVRVGRTLRGNARPKDAQGSPAMLLLMGLGLAANVAGEAIGYLLGERTPRRFVRLTPRAAESG